MDTAPVFMESDHTQVHLALIINKDVEFESFIEQLRRLHPQIGSTVQIDDKQFKMLQFHQGQLVVDVVCLGAQGYQSFAIRATAYLQKYQPRYTLLLGTGVSGQLAPPMVCYIVMACNGDEPCGVSYQSLQQRQWFGPAVQRGCAVSSCIPREQQMTPEEWNKLKSGRRDLLVAEMECSAFFESCNFLGVSCLGCLKGIVESDNDTVHLDDVWIRIAEMVQNRVLPNLGNLQFRQATVTFDGERIAEQYVNNFLINISTCLSRTEKLLTIIKVDEDKLDRTAYPVMPITKCRLGMTDVTIHSDEQARTWTVYKRSNEDRLYDIPTCLNIIREDIERTKHYVKFWEKLQKEIQKRGLNINIVKESDLLPCECFPTIMNQC